MWKSFERWSLIFVVVKMPRARNDETWVQISFLFNTLMQCKCLSPLVRVWVCVCVCGYDFKMPVIGFMNNKASRVEIYYYTLILRLFCCLFAWESTRHWLTTRLCSSKDKRFAYFSFHVIFFFLEKCPFYNLLLVYSVHLFRCCFDAIVACLRLILPCFDAFTIVIHYTRKVALQMARERKR